MKISWSYDQLQRVILNGQCSSWELTQSGVLQDSVSGPLFFLVYMNDLPHNVSSTFKIFADDTSLFSPVFDKTSKH